MQSPTIGASALAAPAPIQAPGDARNELAVLLLEHGDRIRQTIATCVNDPADREDLYQEVCIALWRALPRFRGEASLRTFVSRIARNRAITYAVLRRRRLTREVRLDDDAAAPTELEPAIAASIDAERRAGRLHAALDRLPVDARRILRWRLAGWSDRQVATALGITENNAAVRLFRARVLLRRQLDPRDFAA